jgi:3-oxoacyl-[acyl-carrier-protein] synthase II
VSHRERIFLTGFGTVSTLGATPEAPEFPAAFAAAQANGPAGSLRRIADFAPADYIPEDEARRMDRFTQLGYVAVQRALEHSRLVVEDAHRERIGIILNTLFGPLESTVNFLGKVIRDGAKKAPAAVFPNTVYNAFTGKITIGFGLHGTNSTVSGCNALTYGIEMIRAGVDDALVVGGCEELAPTLVRGFERGGHLGSNGTATSTLALGEGAAALVIERESFARARGATLLAEVLDFGHASAGGEVCEPFPADSEALAWAIEQALARSGAPASEVTLVSTAGNGMLALEAAEERALDGVFGGRALARVATKRVLGETLGPAAAFAAIAAAGALASGGGLALVNAVELGGSVSSLLLAPAP